MTGGESTQCYKYGKISLSKQLMQPLKLHLGFLDRFNLKRLPISALLYFNRIIKVSN